MLCWLKVLWHLGLEFVYSFFQIREPYMSST